MFPSWLIPIQQFSHLPIWLDPNRPISLWTLSSMSLPFLVYWYVYTLVPCSIATNKPWIQVSLEPIYPFLYIPRFQVHLVPIWLGLLLTWVQATLIPSDQFTKAPIYQGLLVVSPGRPGPDSKHQRRPLKRRSLRAVPPSSPLPWSTLWRFWIITPMFQHSLVPSSIETWEAWNQATWVPSSVGLKAPWNIGTNLPRRQCFSFPWDQLHLVSSSLGTHLPFTCWYQFIQIHINQVSWVPIHIGFYISMFQLTCESSHQAFNFAGFQVLLVSSLIGTKWTWFAYDLVPIFVGFEVAWFQDHLVSSSLGFKITWFRYGLESKSLGFQFSTHQLRLVMPIDSQR